MQQLAEACATVRISHHYAMSPACVFDAWLAPQLAGLWLFATASRPMVNVAIDARSGGAFCFVERRAGTAIEHRGHYVEIVRPQRLVFMLQSPDCAPQASHVTAEFKPHDTGCALTLIHDGLPADRIMRVESRWTGMLYGLDVVLSRQGAGE